MSKKQCNYNPLHREINITDGLVLRFWEKVDKSKDCWEWTASKNKQGYGRIGISNGQCMNAHRVSWVIHFGAIPQGDFVCHKCDNPSCVNPSHLFIGSRQDNINDMMIKKRSKHFKNTEYFGVRFQERYDGDNCVGRWHSIITKGGKIKRIGAHTSVLEAARNYDRIAYIVYGERERLNFLEEYKITLKE